MTFTQNVSAQPEKNYDTLIRGALIFDGDAVEPFQADVAIQGDKIAEIGNIKKSAARKVVDGRGLVLAPGFIDAHTHSDFNPLIYPDLPNKILQGVTTEIVGNCGMSAAPVIGAQQDQIRGVWAREGVDIQDNADWRTFKEYRERLEQAGLSTNFVALVGHGNLRAAVMGYAPREATLGEIQDMRKLLREAMEEGAAGISYGLVYLPGIFAPEAELVDLCEEAGKNSGLCAFHMRSEGGGVLDAVSETLRIGEKARTSVEISHLKAAGKANWEKIQEVFKLIEQGRLKGQRITADVYPYTGSFAELGVVLPDALYQREDRVAYFRNLLKRDELLKELRNYYEGRNMKWDSVMIAATHHKKYWKYEGKTIRNISRQTGKEPEQFLIEILADTQFEVSAYYFSQSEEVVSQVVKKPYTAIGSDSIADGSRRPHPRAFGTFPRVLGEYVRERKEMSLGEALWKMSALPAEQFYLKNRGKIKPGYYADLVLFDAGEIKDRATYEKPKEMPQGVKWVFVNGQPAVEKGKPTGRKSGRFLKPAEA
jgi:N-acyl-D-amino-acid deacylase